MKKIFIFVFIMALLCMGRTSRSDYLYETDGTMYVLGNMFVYSTCICCEVGITFINTSGIYAKGLLFIDKDPYNNNKPLMITVLGTAYVNSWTIEGNWIGSGSRMTGIINTSPTNSTYYDTHLYFSSGTPSAAMLPMSQSEFNPKVKHPYPGQRPTQARLGDLPLRSKE